MARTFDGSDDTGESGAAAVSAAPFAMACWHKPPNVLGTENLIGVSRTDANHYWRLSKTNDDLLFRAAAGGSAQTSTFSDVLATGTWSHVAGLELAANSRFAYHNGTAGTENTISRSPASVNRTNVGAYYLNGALTEFSDGDFAEVAIWDLTNWGADAAARKAAWDLAVASLAKGYSPLFFPVGLVFYAPLMGNSSPEPDHVGGFNLTLTGTTKAEHPRIIVPHRAKLIVPVAAGGGTFTASSALTSAPTTLSASATFAPGTKTASAALTSQPTTLVATATHDAPVYTATAGLTSQPSTLAADATFTGMGTFTATAALTSAPTTLAATAQHVTPTYTAAASLASQPSTLAADAEVTNPTYEASAALTSQATTLAATALHSPSVSLASAALVSQPGTLAASVQHTAPVYTAAAALMSAVSQLSAAAQVQNPTYTATASLVSQSSVLGASAGQPIVVGDPSSGARLWGRSVAARLWGRSVASRLTEA